VQSVRRSRNRHPAAGPSPPPDLEADPRPRAPRLSHHSLTAYGRVALHPADVVVPDLPGDFGEPYGTPRSVEGAHRVVRVRVDGCRRDARGALKLSRWAAAWTTTAPTSRPPPQRPHAAGWWMYTTRSGDAVLLIEAGRASTVVV